MPKTADHVRTCGLHLQARSQTQLCHDLAPQSAQAKAQRQRDNLASDAVNPGDGRRNIISARHHGRSALNVCLPRLIGQALVPVISARLKCRRTRRVK